MSNEFLCSCDTENCDMMTKRWPRYVVTWGFVNVNEVNLPWMKVLITKAFASWAKVIYLEFVYVEDGTTADCRISFGLIDGSFGILAYSGLSDGSGNAIDQNYDVSDVGSLVNLVAVATHEIGHFLGLTHDSPTANAIMRPVYSPHILGPTVRDIKRLITLGYSVRVHVEGEDEVNTAYRNVVFNQKFLLILAFGIMAIAGLGLATDDKIREITPIAQAAIGAIASVLIAREMKTNKDNKDSKIQNLRKE